MPGPISAADIGHMLDRTSDIWPQFRGARLLITGGTGFVGKWMLHALLAAEDRHDLNLHVTVLTRNAARFRQEAPWLAEHPRLALHEGDIRDFSWPESSFSHVVHAATDMEADNDVLLSYDIIVEGTRRMLDFCVQRGVTDVLLISSGAVYGIQPPELPRVPEDFTGAPSTMQPATAYGQGKRAAEWLVAAYNARHGLNGRVARCFAFLGAYLPLDKSYAAGNFVGNLLTGQPILIKGDGTAVRSYLYAADMSIWLWKILARGTPGLPYNVGGEDDVSIRDLALRVAALGPAPLPVTVLGQPKAGTLPARYVPSTARARDTLGLRQWITVDEALRRMVDCHNVPSLTADRT